MINENSFQSVGIDIPANSLITFNISIFIYF